MTSHAPQDLYRVHLDAHDDARALIRLIQCSRCSHPLRTPVTLPCGNSLCRDCLPSSQLRTNITFPALAQRQYGIPCPFDQCSQMHATNDCNINVTMMKIMDAINAQATREKQEPSPPLVRMITSTLGDATQTPVSQQPQRFSASGGRLTATLDFARSGLLEFATEVAYESSLDPSAEKERDGHFLGRIREAVQAEMECHVCYSLMLDPTTTPCGHTFCRKCLARILDHSSLCPECRRTLFLPSSLSRQPSNKQFVDLLNALCSEQVVARARTAAAEEQRTPDGLDTPLFPCTMAFPGLRTYLHIFEPRYRLMVRRAIESNGRFGMVAYNRLFENQGHLGRVHFMDVGTVLQIERYQILPDGRSFLECRGLHRFRVRNHDLLDGYIIANVEKVEDISLAEEEQLEADETSTTVLANDDAVAHIERKSTTELRDTVKAFVSRARANSARWFSARLLETYGEPPDDPANLPYWVAAVLPLVDEEKQKILPLTSTRERLKLAAKWVHRIESQRWYVPFSPFVLECI